MYKFHIVVRPTTNEGAFSSLLIPYFSEPIILSCYKMLKEHFSPVHFANKIIFYYLIKLIFKVFFFSLLFPQKKKEIVLPMRL